MGMYTEIRLKAKLRRDVPSEVVDLFGHVFGGVSPEPLPGHPFFECERWQSALIGASAYFDTDNSSIERVDGQWEVSISSSLKNYGGEDDKLFDWLDQYIDAEPGTSIGHTQYEEDDVPTQRVKR